MIAAFPSLAVSQWLALVHPVLIILFVYPVIGATIRLGILARERRLQLNPIAPTVPVEHVDHGRWATGALLLAVLIALGHGLAGAGAGLATWLVVSLQAAAAAAAFVALLRTRRLMFRLLFAWSCWLFLLLIILQPLLMAERSLLALGIPHLGWPRASRFAPVHDGCAAGDRQQAVDAPIACVPKCVGGTVAGDPSDYGYP